MKRIATALLLLAACDAFGLEQSAVTSRAAGDLSCKRDAVAVKPRGEGTHAWDASGCGQAASYTCVRGEGVGQSQWSCIKEK